MKFKYNGAPYTYELLFVSFELFLVLGNIIYPLEPEKYMADDRAGPS